MLKNRETLKHTVLELQRSCTKFVVAGLALLKHPEFDTMDGEQKKNLMIEAYAYIDDEENAPLLSSVMARTKGVATIILSRITESNEKPKTSIH